ncbi:MAG: CRISPR-associated helicase Cas3' [Dysgonamonadaceae bacterium]|nr:CRISPR-associated helicase Cas3' [Dysgonamonadaceae bacterium]
MYDMRELLSHPNKLLLSHLRHVASIAVAAVNDRGYRFVVANSVITNRQLSDLMWIVAASHDIAKATVHFQNYIRNPDGIHSNLKNHSLLSSLFGYYVAIKFCKQLWSDKIIAELIPVMVFIAIKRHHGNIENLEKEVLLSNDDIEYLSEQIRSIDADLIEPIILNLFRDQCFDVTWCDFLEFWNDSQVKQKLSDFRVDFRFSYPKLDERSRFILFNLFQILYATLMYADKSDVILQDVRVEKKDTNFERCLNRFRKENGFNNPDSEINRMKNEAYFNTLKYLEVIFKPEQHLYSITLPTGLGKTLLAFGAAEKIRSLTGNSFSKTAIVIPFTSIIDQNFEVYRQVVKSDSSEVIMKHHHLNEPIYKDSSERVFEYDKSQFLIETWQSEIVVTTFVQFLETILSMDKTKLMKLANLKNAIILLDEIQTIPYELWETVRKTFISLGESLNIYFVLISATQPLIFTPGEDIVELVPDHRKYFKFFNRTRLHYVKESVSFDTFVQGVSEYLEKEPQKDVAVIMNTKKAALECYVQLVDSDLFEEKSNEFYFLSTLITPHERKQIIKKIKGKSEKRKILVSTQLIEAGVDISVDTVFRQLSPIDSIIQSAGRANRYNEKHCISDVFLYDIAGEHSKTSSRIYGSDLMLKTKIVLSNIEVLEEKNYLELIDRYFMEVRKQSDETTSDLLNAILSLQFAQIDLKYIEERRCESVFVQLNKEAKKVWEQYLELYDKNGLTPWERKTLFSSFKSLFYDYVINVPIPYGETRINFDSEKVYGFYVSKLDHPATFYSYSSKDTQVNTGYDARKNMVSI